MNMGTIIPARKFLHDNKSGLLKPIIYCGPHKGITDGAVSINLPLAEKLAGCRPNRRTMRIETFFNQILDQLPEGTIIKDFDVMFNPEYKVDVLRIMIVACKKKSFSVVWPGKYKNGKLFYADEAYSDFKVFDIEKYDVTCIV